MDLTPVYHAIAAALLQYMVGLAINNWFTGGALCCTWFIAREHTKAEYRWIETIGNGKRANMPWLGGFNPKAWDSYNMLDWLVPVAFCGDVYVVTT